MNQVAKRSGHDLLMFDAEARRVVDDVVSFWPDDGSPVALRRELTKDERRSLAARRLELDRVLRPVRAASEDMKRAAECIAQLFLGFPSMRNIDAQGMVTAYVQHMSHLPLYAIRAACEDVTKGRVKGLDPDWPPTSVRLVEVANPHVAPQEEEITTITKALAGKVPEREPTPEERERVRIGLRKMSESFQGGVDHERVERAERVQKSMIDGVNEKILREYARLGREPAYADPARTILLSPALAAKG